MLSHFSCHLTFFKDKLTFVDVGRSDGESVMKLVQQLKPRRVIVVRGNADKIKTLVDISRQVMAKNATTSDTVTFNFGNVAIFSWGFSFQFSQAKKLSFGLESSATAFVSFNGLARNSALLVHISKIRV